MLNVDDPNGEEVDFPAGFKDAASSPEGRWVTEKNICLPGDVTAPPSTLLLPPSPSSPICLAGAPLIPKSEEKTRRRRIGPI